jgi:hypothetical protein
VLLVVGLWPACIGSVLTVEVIQTLGVWGCLENRGLLEMGGSIVQYDTIVVYGDGRIVQ